MWTWFRVASLLSLATSRGRGDEPSCARERRQRNGNGEASVVPDDERLLCTSVVSNDGTGVRSNEGDYPKGASARRRVGVERSRDRTGTYGPRPPPTCVDRARFSIHIRSSSRIHRLQSSRRRVESSRPVAPRARALASAFSSPRRTSPHLVAGFPCVPVSKVLARIVQLPHSAQSTENLQL